MDRTIDKLHVIKAEVRDPEASTFVVSDERTMYGGKRIAAGDCVFNSTVHYWRVPYRQGLDVYACIEVFRNGDTLTEWGNRKPPSER
jgi:hypothetical protein